MCVKNKLLCGRVAYTEKNVSSFRWLDKGRARSKKKKKEWAIWSVTRVDKVVCMSDRRELHLIDTRIDRIADR